jgi:ribosomal protein S18 acetylase RimI-like enzyme
MRIRAAGDVAVVRELFREYQVGVDAPVCFTSFDSELAGLPAPYFAILVAEVDGVPAGCVALKALDGQIAEVKRLYVRAGFRRLGLGEQLMRAAVAAASGAGYGTVRLDTLPFMASAIALYTGLGFVRIPRYNDNPDADALFFEISS